MPHKIILVFFLYLFLMSCKEHENKSLPIYNPSDLNPELVDKSLLNKNNNHTVANFNLINQNGDSITQDTYKNKIYVTDFFFTRCPSICPIMTNNMAVIQNKFLNILLIISVSAIISSVSMSSTPRFLSAST